MADEDKLMGRRDGTPVYGAYRVDYASTDDIRDDIDVPDAVKVPTAGHPDHPVPDSYARKAVCETAAARDAVQAALDDRGIDYQTTDVAPTATEKQHLRDWGAETGVEGVDALRWGAGLDAATSVADLKAVRRGEHPDTGERFDPPKRPTRGG